MNYLLKRQSSPAGFVLNSTKLTSERLCFSRDCLASHAVFQRNVQCRNSSYMSALKVEIKKSKSSKKNENFTTKGANASKKITEMLKVMPPKNSIKKLIGYKNRVIDPSHTQGMTGSVRSIVDCTKSYDPSLLNFNLKVEEFSHACPNNTSAEFVTGNLKKSRQGGHHKILYEEISQINLRSSSSVLNEKPNQQKNVLVCNPQPVENLNLLEHQPEIKINPLQPFEKIKELSVTQDEKWIDSDDIPEMDYSQDYNFTQILYSSIDICITNNMPREAYQLFESYRRKAQWKAAIQSQPKVIQDVYNSLLYALSSEGYWYITNNVLKCMTADKINLNSASFAALLNCLATLRKSKSNEFLLEEVSGILNSIFVNNIPLNDVLCQAALLHCNTEEILEIVRQVVPSFEMKPNVMELNSDCRLLRNLNMSPTNLQPPLEGLGVEEMNALVDEQLEMERNFYLGVKAVSRGKPEAPHDKKVMVENLKKEWRNSLTKAVHNLLANEKLRFSKEQNTFNLYIYLSSLTESRLVDILMESTQHLVHFSGGFGPSASHLRKVLGSKVKHSYCIRKKDAKGITDKVEQLYKKYMSWYVNPSGPARNSRQKWQMVIQDAEKTNQLGIPIIGWPDQVVEKLGDALLKIILQEVKFNTPTKVGLWTRPVLYTILRCRENAYCEEIKCHPRVSELFEQVGFDILHFPCEEVPMVCPPKPWTAYNDGGYLSLNTDLIRKKFGNHGKTVNLKKVPVQKLYATLDSLNALQSVPWMINEDVLDVALDVFRNGGLEKLSVPLFPEKPPPIEKWTDLSFRERRSQYMERAELIKKLANNYSLWCEALYRLSLANHFRKRVFWMPQNCDFRGRVYPVPPLVNHLGSDLFRSLLVFAKAKPLGPKGLDWLKIHLVNLTGTHKKKSVEERLAYANEILPVILDSAENPLTGDKWWMESEEPWQTLGACIEVKKALSVPNPEVYMCRFPVHQDGSCNGLQHYAALGKDLTGAESVNLTSCDKPQDVYNVVAGLVEQERVADAAEGVEIAKILEGFVERKVVKQTVMTTVYGVTGYGAKLQIAKRLEEIPNFPQEYVNAAAAYLMTKIFLSLRKMFTSAKQIQDWFTSCAREICLSGEYVQWISPMGLPVVQPYAKYRQSSERNKRILAPDMLKQRNAFPPNFIHSLDSSHMMLTSLHCEQAGLTFAAVHDCFWTHPCNVDVMNKICREQFISLHSLSILEELSLFLRKTYANKGMSEEAMKTLETLPEKGTFDIREVMDSVYFFS